MIRTTCISPDCNDVVDESNDTLHEVIKAALTYWGDTTLPQCYIMTDELAVPLAVMIRDKDDYMIVHVTYCNGRNETYRGSKLMRWQN